MRLLVMIVGLIVLGLTVSYLGMGITRPALNDAERAALQSDGTAHAFISTEVGMVHYRDEGAKAAPTILLVHGFSTPSIVYQDYFQKLTSAGYRVIAFDTIGRGYSDRPATTYDEDLFLVQIKSLKETLEVQTPFHLVGYSMGGGIVADYAARYPEDAASVTFLAAVGFSDVDGVPGYLLWPGVGDWVFRVLGPQVILPRLEDGLEAAADPDDFVRRFRHQAAYGGYYEALLSTMRNYSFGSREQKHRSFGSAGLRILSVWGDEDTTVPIEGADRLAAWNEEAKTLIIDGGTHSITYSHADEITDFMIANLR